MRVRVTNAGPGYADAASVSAPLLALFRDVLRLSEALPFTHQAEAFEFVASQNREVRLVAGTAAGKTLAVGVPLAWKLQQGLIRRTVLMYPTLALLEDQRKVMDRLAEHTGLTVGELKGGLTRSKLIASLNKQILLATPDAVYWFFRKNVKYNSLLIYGLAQVDEFVLDEAHLFNGLMLCNFKHLWQRVKTLAECLGKTPRLHILTATPTDELSHLTDAEEISGKSKGHDVSVELCPSGWRDRDKEFVMAVNEMLDAGQRKLLVVCNSARMAHQLFEKFSVADVSEIPVEHRLKFGKVKLGQLTRCLEKSGIERDVLDDLANRLSLAQDVVLADVPNGVTLKLSVEEVALHVNEILERQCSRVKRALWLKQQRSGETWESVLNNRSLPSRIIAQLRPRLEETQDVKAQEAAVDEWLAQTSESLSDFAIEEINCRAGKFGELKDAFVSLGIDRELSALLTKRLSFEMKADPSQLPAQDFSRRPVYLRSLQWLLEEVNADRIRECIKAGLESGELEVECRHIGLWKKTGVPVIVYSGSMARHAREGLINVFADLDRAVLISTSAVEVGVDFHADVLITEECEGNSFLQRFGRVGRHSDGSKVIGLLSGDTYAQLSELDGAEISREEFSARIIHAFPHRTYAAASQLLDASHYLINEQVGRIGERLNARVDGKVKAVAEQLRSAGIQMGFGLRSTMPQITLRDGITKDPFYLLRYVDDQDLRPADSPFEVAEAKTWFTSLIFQRARFNIVVNLEETLKASQHLLISHAGEVSVLSARAIAYYHLSKLTENVEWTEKQPLYFILSHGDVYLSRIERGLEMAPEELVTDAQANPLFISNQSYLVLWGWTDSDKTRGLLENAKTADWEELHYDWDSLQCDQPKAMVILEKTTGACFAAYQELLNYVNRQAQN